MKVLIYGAGVIGTLYGGKLADAGHTVTVVARGRRLAEIREQGLVLEDVVHHRRLTASVKTVDRLDPDDEQDLALITVRRDQPPAHLSVGPWRLDCSGSLACLYRPRRLSHARVGAGMVFGRI